MKTIEAGGKIDQGALTIHNENVYRQQIYDVGFANHVHITLEYGNKRTIDQNSYLWGGIVNPLSVALIQMGWEEYEPDYLYHDLEKSFNKKEIVNRKTGETREVIVPFKKLDTETFAEKIDQIRAWAHRSETINIYLKAPHEYYEMTLDAYSRWKRGEINKTEAIKISQETY